jgi:RNA polymerase sigma-70 factor (ECF subfamily)
MCHELGHIAMYRGMSNLVGLPEGVGEGWAHYAGSVVVDAVAEDLGESIWPEPYDVAATEGTARLRRQTTGTDWDELDAVSCAAKAFLRMDEVHGRRTLGSALRSALSSRPSGKELMPRVVEQLRAITGDPRAGDWIPERLLAPTLRWETERCPGEGFADELRAEPDDTGILLRYDDGTSEGKRSIAGSGHAILFQTPAGEWLLDGVDVFGSRYGTVRAPDEDFTVYVSDAEFEPIREFSRPYSLFARGEEEWVHIDLDPLSVPSRFYICLCFNPTATKGVYLAYDDSVRRSHSRSALPYSHVAPVGEEVDWMIRAHLRRAGDDE